MFLIRRVTLSIRTPRHFQASHATWTSEPSRIEIPIVTCANVTWTVRNKLLFLFFCEFALSDCNIIFLCYMLIELQRIVLTVDLIKRALEFLTFALRCSELCLVIEAIDFRPEIIVLEKGLSIAVKLSYNGWPPCFYSCVVKRRKSLCCQ